MDESDAPVPAADVDVEDSTSGRSTGDAAGECSDATHDRAGRQQVNVDVSQLTQEITHVTHRQRRLYDTQFTHHSLPVAVLCWGQECTGPQKILPRPSPNYFHGNLGLSLIHISEPTRPY